jgi:hypothetical protein
LADCARIAICKGCERTLCVAECCETGAPGAAVASMIGGVGKSMDPVGAKAAPRAGGRVCAAGGMLSIGPRSGLLEISLKTELPCRVADESRSTSEVRRGCSPEGEEGSSGALGGLLRSASSLHSRISFLILRTRSYRQRVSYDEVA